MCMYVSVFYRYYGLVKYNEKMNICKYKVSVSDPRTSAVQLQPSRRHLGAVSGGGSGVQSR